MTNLNLAPASGQPLHTPADERQGQSTARMSDLLRRYPDIEDRERLDLVEFLRRGNPDDLASVTYGNGLETKAVAVKKDHPDQFDRGLRVWRPWLAMLFLTVLLVLLARLI